MKVSIPTPLRSYTGEKKWVEAEGAAGQVQRRPEPQPAHQALELLPAGPPGFLRSPLRHHDGTRGAMQVKKGDRVLFTSYAPETIEIDDEEFLLMSESDILAVIE